MDESYLIRIRDIWMRRVTYESVMIFNLPRPIYIQLPTYTCIYSQLPTYTCIYLQLATYTKKPYMSTKERYISTKEPWNSKQEPCLAAPGLFCGYVGLFCRHVGLLCVCSQLKKYLPEYIQVVTCGWVISYPNESRQIWMRHVTYESIMAQMNVSCNMWMIFNLPGRMYIYVYIFMSRMNESCHTCHVWMSHVTHMNASCLSSFLERIPESFLSVPKPLIYIYSRHVWMSHVATKRMPLISQDLVHMNESYHTWVMSHMNESRLTFEWVMSHMNESCHIWMSHVTYEWVMSRMNESCHTYEWIVFRMNESCLTYEWVMSHVWMSHVTHVVESFKSFCWRDLVIES